MTHIKSVPTLRDLQEYVAEHYRERGFDVGDAERGRSESAIRECLLLVEEVGELAKAIRRDSSMTTDPNSTVGEIRHEIADVIWVVTVIANIYEIDLEEAFREKEVINHGRTWSR